MKIPSFLIGLIAGVLLTAMFVDLSSTRATRACMKDFYSVQQKNHALQDSIKKLNGEVFMYMEANDFARCGIYRYAGLQSLKGEHPDSVVTQILYMGITASPYIHRDALLCDEAFDRVTGGGE